MKKKQAYLFDFHKFIKKLRDDEDTKQNIEDYEKYYGSLEGKGYRDLSFYKEYLSKFEFDKPLMERFLVPEGTQDEFDYDMLFRLVIGSASSDYKLTYSGVDDGYVLHIGVSRDDGSILWRRLDELTSRQIHRLFETYLSEEICLANLKMEFPQEDDCYPVDKTAQLGLFRKRRSELALEHKRELEHAAKRCKLIHSFNELISC